jgi:tetratricopeptide (TPR) repeat protein
VNPRFAPAFFNRGNAWRAKGDDDRAIADLHEAIRLNPNFAEKRWTPSWLSR